MEIAMFRPLAALLFLSLAGCTITKNPEVTGGNQMMGLVQLGFDVPALQRARIDDYLALSTATKQCQNWGYDRAVRYGDPIYTCSVISGTQCLNESVTLNYQCQGVALPTAQPVY